MAACYTTLRRYINLKTFPVNIYISFIYTYFNKIVVSLYISIELIILFQLLTKKSIHKI